MKSVVRCDISAGYHAEIIWSRTERNTTSIDYHAVFFSGIIDSSTYLEQSILPVMVATLPSDLIEYYMQKFFIHITNLSRQKSIKFLKRLKFVCEQNRFDI